MRLLQYNNDSDFSLTEFFENDMPKYAILSHRWGAEEVTFKDLIDGTGKSKAGYGKIQFCREQARRDKLHYFWVDTCCIDKSNSTELAESINSMFRWYRDAAKCYVYLSDVSTTKRKASDQFSEFTWEPAFQASRWFTRGWTLQELLAPGLVEFFSREGKRLGDKKTLERQVHEITGIAVSALQGSPLSQFGVDERLSWADNRQTTRKEDKAYSLLGIFDVYMPLIYGEGGENALNRLREEINKPLKGIDRLPSAADAPFNSYNKQHASTCLPNTRVDLLHEIYKWADGQDKRCIFWLKGLAGTGKSTIARTIARRYFDEKRLGASFFFSRGDGDVSHTGKFFTSLASQLACNIPQIQRFISDVIIEQSDIASQSLRDQWRQLVFHPLSRLDGSLSLSSYVLIVDALDECDNEDHIGIILQLLAEARLLEVRLRVLITSRPVVPIRYGFCQIPNAEHRDFILHDIKAAIVDRDIFNFLHHEMGSIGQEWALEAGWPGEQALRQLVVNASGLFIWAATACRFIRDGREYAERRLSLILQSSASATAPERHLNEIYITVLKNSIGRSYDEFEREDTIAKLRKILGSIIVLSSPLSTSSISRLLRVAKRVVDQTLNHLHAILDVPEDQTCPLRLHHPSFRDFLLDKDRCSDPKFWVDERQAHQTLADYCIRLMSDSLKQDVCGQEAPGTLVTDVESSRREQCLPLDVEYACLYWVQHLQKSDTKLYDNDQVHQFLQVHLLHWLEALGWMGKTSEGVLAILSLEALILADKGSNLQAFVHDTKRFALYNRSVVEQAPLQLYCSALVFTPEKSIVRRRFENSIPPWIQTKPKVQANLNVALQTLEGHTRWVTSVTFSLDGKVVASSSGDMTVRLWDAVTGAPLQTLEAHADWVRSVAFSPNSKVVVSGSDDMTVRLWDAVTGAPLQILEGHLNWVSSVAFSPNGKVVVSGSDDKTVRLWDAVTGAPLLTLEGHLHKVRSVAFSLDGRVVASGGDITVRLWDAVTGAPLQTLKGHASEVTSVAFSLNGKLVVSGSYDETVRVWDVITGAPLLTLECHSRQVHSVAFSPDGRLVASGLDDMTVRLWDAVTGAPLQTLEGHANSVRSVAFSPDGKVIASGSDDRTVRLWDVATEVVVPLQTLEGHASWVRSVAFSPDGKLIASGSDDKTVRLWDAIIKVLLQTLKGHINWVSSVSFSPNNKVVASGSGDKTVRLWDAVTGAPLRTLQGHLSPVKSVTFSPDGKVVASSGSGDMTIRLWDAMTGVPLQMLEDYASCIRSVPFSPDSKIVHTLFVSNNWIAEGDTNILWLPFDYRATCVAVWNTLVVLGHSSGRISFLEFREGLKHIL